MDFPFHTFLDSLIIIFRKTSQQYTFICIKQGILFLCIQITKSLVLGLAYSIETQKYLMCFLFYMTHEKNNIVLIILIKKKPSAYIQALFYLIYIHISVKESLGKVTKIISTRVKSNSADTIAGTHKLCTKMALL